MAPPAVIQTQTTCVVGRATTRIDVSRPPDRVHREGGHRINGGIDINSPTSLSTVCFVAILYALGAGGAVGQEESTCPPSTTEVNEASGGAVLSASISPGGTLVTAHTILARAPRRSGVPVRLLNELGQGVRTLDLPKGRYDFLYPKVAHDLGGRLHLVWGESGTSSRANALWHSVHQRDGEWSEPRLVHESSFITWDELLGNVLPADEGSIHILVPSPFGAATYIRSSLDGFIRSPLPIRIMLFSDLVSTSDGTLLMAFVGAVDNNTDAGPAAGNGVFTIRSEDGGRSWSDPTPVYSESPGFAQTLWLFSGENTLTLAWATNLEGGVLPNHLRARRSTDGGRTWKVLAESTTTGQFVAGAVAASPVDDRLLFVWIPLRPNDDFVPLLGLCLGQGIETRQELMQRPQPQWPFLFDDPSGKIRLIWSEGTESRELASAQLRVSICNRP